MHNAHQLSGYLSDIYVILHVHYALVFKIYTVNQISIYKIMAILGINSKCNQESFTIHSKVILKSF